MLRMVDSKTSKNLKPNQFVQRVATAAPSSPGYPYLPQFATLSRHFFLILLCPSSATG
jgi:hypothetical protein